MKYNLDFNFTSSEFKLDNLNNALVLAKMSDLAYKNKDVITSDLTNNWGACQAKFIECGETQCFIALFEEGLILSFRGTEQNKIADWLTDLDFIKMNGPWGKKIHRGFYTALLSVWEKLNQALKELQPNTLFPLWITGHSLGGALAVLATVQFIAEKRRVSGLMTFGQPRVGDKDFTDEFNLHMINAVRFVNNEDIVARIPKFKYDHVGDKCYFDGQQKAILNPSIMETWIDSLNEINFRSLKIDKNFVKRHPNSIEDHAIDRYIACIEKNMPKNFDNKSYSGFLKYINKA